MLEAIDLSVVFKLESQAVGAEKRGDGRVEVKLGNEETDICDLLVAADGGRSKVRGALRPEDGLEFQGVACIMAAAKFEGKVPGVAGKDVSLPTCFIFVI